MKTQLQLSAVACTGSPCGCPANNNVPPLAVRASLAGAPSNGNVRAYCIRPSKGHPQGVPLRFAQWIFLQFCIFAFLPIFAQTPAPDFTDPRDGETYKTVIMPDGKRWMAENLRYRKGLDNPVFGYRGYNGVTVTSNIAAPGTNLQKTYYCPGPGPFPTSPNTTTTSQADPLRCEYEGALYPFWTAYGQNQGTANVFATLGEQGVCPNGWHFPSDGEWSALAAQLNNDYSSLLVLNAGYRVNTGVYADRTTKAYFWTSTGSGTAAVSRSFSGGTITRTASQPASDALSVRCIEGACKESSQIVLAMVQNSYGSGCTAYTEAKTNSDSIVFRDASMSRKYNITLNPVLSTGTWTYSVACSDLPSGVACTPSVSAAQITLAFTGLSAAADNQVFTLKVAGLNSSYCKLDTQFYSIKLIYNPPTSNSFSYVASTYSGASTASTHVINAPGNDVNGATGVLTDGRDGKTYTTKKMPDGQWWMTKNLEVGTCPNGATGWNTTVNAAWGSTYDQASNWNINGTELRGKCRQNGTYGYLYNWIAATQFPDGCGQGQDCPASNWQNKWVQGICPNGWHLPTGGTCGDFANMPFSTTPSTWYSTWLGVYGGFCLNTGSMYYQGSIAYYWSSAQTSTNDGCSLDYTSSVAFPTNPNSKEYGFSVRCIKNN